MLKALLIACIIATGMPVQAGSNGLPIEGVILPGWREADGRHVAGLLLKLDPGWKTYWRAPGAGGIPPRFNWSGSSNLAAVEVRYPVPKIMDQNGVYSIGYDHDVVLPLVIQTRENGMPVNLHAEIEIGVCEEVCIPVALRVSATLPETGSHDANIAGSLSNQPIRVGGLDCEIAPISDGLRLTAKTKQANLRADIAVVELSEPGVWVSPADMAQRGNRLVAHVEMVPPNAQPFALARSGVRMTLIGEGRAIELNGCR